MLRLAQFDMRVSQFAEELEQSLVVKSAPHESALSGVVIM